jgi:hypothetical protein
LSRCLCDIRAIVPCDAISIVLISRRESTLDMRRPIPRDSKERDPPHLTCLQRKLIKIVACVVRYARAIFQLAEVVVTSAMMRTILAAIRRLRAAPLCACPQTSPKPNESGSPSLFATL